MKVIIWLACAFFASLIGTGLSKGGAILGIIPTVILFGGAIFLARFLCRKWDDRQMEKEFGPRDNNTINNVQIKKKETQTQVKKCKKCGTKIEGDKNFCENCIFNFDEM